MEYLWLTLRVISIMGLLFFLVLVTGRRKIAELAVFDFLAIIILGNVVGGDIANPNVPHFQTAYAVILIVAFQYLISHFIVKNRKFGSKVTFEPKVIIQNGEFVKSNMENIKYSIENVLMHLREQGIFDLREVEFAVVEDSGKISVQKKSQFQPLTPSDMDISTDYKGMSVPLIIDGEVYEKNLKKLDLDRSWLEEKLRNHNLHSFDEVFYADLNTEGELYISKGLEQDGITEQFKV